MKNVGFEKVLIAGAVVVCGVMGYFKYQEFSDFRKEVKKAESVSFDVSDFPEVLDTEETEQSLPPKKVKAKAKRQVRLKEVPSSEILTESEEPEVVPAREMTAKKEKPMTLEEANDLLETVNDSKENVQNLFGY